MLPSNNTDEWRIVQISRDGFGRGLVLDGLDACFAVGSVDWNVVVVVVAASSSLHCNSAAAAAVVDCCCFDTLGCSYSSSVVPEEEEVVAEEEEGCCSSMTDIAKTRRLHSWCWKETT